jgi:hypothetical protein
VTQSSSAPSSPPTCVRAAGCTHARAQRARAVPGRAGALQRVCTRAGIASSLNARLCPWAAQDPAPHELLVAALWRFAHLLLARAPGAHDAAAREVALRLSASEEVPLDSMRGIADAFKAQLASRQLRPRVAGWRERALGAIRLPGLRRSTAGEGGGAAADDRRRLARDAFYALGALALTARRARALTHC